MENYEPLSFIGKGNFGSITKIKRKVDGKILVWKEFNYGSMREKDKNRIVQEVNILHELHHPNIVKYYDRIIDKKNTKLYIVMEYCPGGDLSQLIKRNRKTNQYFAVLTNIKSVGVMGDERTYDYTISLGSNSVKLFEMTRAYGVFANGGFRVEPYAIERIESSRGTVIYEAKKAKTSKVLNINTAATMTAIMKTVIQSGTGRGANIGKPAAGKTGTTDDCKDAYFIGFTPDVVTGVWVGNDDNTRMGELTGGTVPAKIWKDVMTVATEPYGNSDFEYPEIILNPFKAPSVSVISQSEARKAWEEKEEKEKQKKEEEIEMPIVKPDSIKPSGFIPLPSIKKKETVKTIEAEKPAQAAEQFAPIPISNSPINSSASSEVNNEN